MPAITDEQGPLTVKSLEYNLII